MTNEELMDWVIKESWPKIGYYLTIYNSLDTKASRIIFFLWAIIWLFLQKKLHFFQILALICFGISIGFSIIVIRPKKLNLWNSLPKTTDRHWNQNTDKYSFIKDSVWNINKAFDNNTELIDKKSKYLKKSIIMLSIWMWIIIIYIIFYNISPQLCQIIMKNS